jgi:hypothetical protein
MLSSISVITCECCNGIIPEQVFPTNIDEIPLYIAGMLVEGTFNDIRLKPRRHRELRFFMIRCSGVMAHSQTTVPEEYRTIVKRPYRLFRTMTTRSRNRLP